MAVQSKHLVAIGSMFVLSRSFRVCHAIAWPDVGCNGGGAASGEPPYRGYGAALSVQVATLLFTSSMMEMCMHVTHAADGPVAPTIAFDAFLAVDIRVGTVVAAEPFPEARKLALKLTIDFGPVVGRKRSSAQIGKHYGADTVVGRQVAAVVNFPARQIGKFMSEVLTLGFPDVDGEVVLFAPDQKVPDGGRLF